MRSDQPSIQRDSDLLQFRCDSSVGAAQDCIGLFYRCTTLPAPISLSVHKYPKDLVAQIATRKHVCLLLLFVAQMQTSALTLIELHLVLICPLSQSAHSSVPGHESFFLE